jgi:23S rRNA pseudouridine1911/1915/1917 synthase
MRLDKRIAQLFGLSRRAAQEAVRQGQVDVNGQPALDPALEVAPQARLVYHANRPRAATTARRLHVLYEDSQILIVNKPAGVLTQPTPARERDTLLERAGRYLARKHGQKRPYVGIVHRLDQDTTGVILMVTQARALRSFQAMFRAHAVERGYVGVVEGVFLTPSGRIDLPLVSDRGDGRRGVSRDPSLGVPTVTHFKVLETFGQTASMVECRLETGRTHQIRIHLAEIGHPVVGDPVYRPRTDPRFPVPFGRQALHAQSLCFVHPFSHESIGVQAPLPADLTELAAELRDRFGSLVP